MKRIASHKWFRNQFIRNKIIAIYLPLILIPLLVLGVVSNQIYTNAIVEKTTQNVSENSSLIFTRIAGILANTESCANILTINLNRTFQEQEFLVNQVERDHRAYTEITNQLSYALLVFPDVHSAAFIDNNGRVYGSSLAMEQHDSESILHIPLSKSIMQTSGENIWFAMERRHQLTPDEQTPVLTLGKKIVNIQTGKQLGLLVLNVREQTLSNVYKRIGMMQNGSYTITDQQGTVISSSQTAELLQPLNDPALRDWVVTANQPSVIGQFDGDKMLVVQSDFSSMDWRLISMVPFTVLTADNRKITVLIIIIGGLCFLFALFGAAILNRFIAQPIVRMTKTMRLVKEGNLDVELQVQTNDELGMLASGFNMMIIRVQELLNKVKLEQDKKREYELALIQAQIKPHFLYNTLDVIYTLSGMGRAKDVQKTTKALADYYRAVLSKGRELVTLEEELNGLRDYLAIQRIRYSDVFDYDILVDKQLLGCTLLKLTLQPLVENAIYHGLKTKEEFGHLAIECRLEEDMVMLIVKDNGVGMSEHKLAVLNRQLRIGEEAVSFGLHNVNNRITLFFGEMYGLELTSQLGNGTTVTVKLPLMIEEQHNNKTYSLLAPHEGVDRNA